jgi:hypothetical protein
MIVDKAPVIGSGSRGMRVKGGQQIICERILTLKENVCMALDHPERGERGYEFANNLPSRIQ